MSLQRTAAQEAFAKYWADSGIASQTSEDKAWRIFRAGWHEAEASPEEKPKDDPFLRGICVSLDVIYSLDLDPHAVLPCELVSTLDPDELLAFAIREDEPSLERIRKTVALVKRTHGPKTP